MILTALYTAVAIVGFCVAFRLGFSLGGKLSEIASLSLALPVIAILYIASSMNDDFSGSGKVFFLTALGFAGALCVAAASPKDAPRPRY
jgi:hypothetical protein